MVVNELDGCWLQSLDAIKVGLACGDKVSYGKRPGNATIIDQIRLSIVTIGHGHGWNKKKFTYLEAHSWLGAISCNELNFKQHFQCDICATTDVPCRPFCRLYWLPWSRHDGIMIRRSQDDYSDCLVCLMP